MLTHEKTTVERYENLVRTRKEQLESQKKAFPNGAHYAFGLGRNSDFYKVIDEVEGSGRIAFERKFLLDMEAGLVNAVYHRNRARELAKLGDGELAFRSMDHARAVDEALRRTDASYRGYAEQHAYKKAKIMERASRTEELGRRIFPDTFDAHGVHCNPEVHSADPVYSMLSSIDRRSMDRGKIVHESVELMGQIRDRAMPREVYVSLLHGTHPVVKEAKKLALTDETRIKGREMLLQEQRHY